jgi:putative spermidine/putrescine transport system ATP-binding protein
MGSRLELHGLRKAFGPTHVLQDFDLSIASGEFVSLLGPSGCGKTTTLNIVAGFFDPDGGTVELDGKDVIALPSYRRGVSMVFQNYALFPHMTVADNVAFGLRMHGMAKREIAPRVAEMLALVKLPAVGDRFPRQLSGGQQQRIGLARALATHPGLLLLDEPLSNLDARLRREMQIEIRQILDRVDATTLYVTHDQEEAMTMSDRIVVMNRGQAEQVGTPQDVYCRPRTRFVAELVGESNFVEVVVTTVADSHATVTFPNGTSVTIPARGTPVAVGDRLLLLARPGDVMVRPNSADGLRGEVTASAFAGERLRLEVQVSGIGLFRCTAPITDAEVLSRGTRVCLLVDQHAWTIVGPGAGAADA